MFRAGTSSGIPAPHRSAAAGPTRSSARSGSLQTTALPRLIGIEGTRAAWQIRAAGAIHVGYSTITDYPLGIVKLLPHRKAHTGGRAVVRAAA